MSDHPQPFTAAHAKCKPHTWSRWKCACGYEQAGNPANGCVYCGRKQ